MQGKQSDPRRRSVPTLALTLAALAVLVGATFVYGRAGTGDPAATAPVDLSAPLGLTPDQLSQWCQDRLAADTSTLSTNAVNWLRGCAEAFAPTPTPTVAASPTTTPPPMTTPPMTTPPVTTPPATGTPTMSPPPTPKLDCTDDPVSCGFPGPTNTGVPVGTMLTTVNGDVYVTTPGATISGEDIHGCVFIQANNVTIVGSRITCTGAYGVRTFNGSVNYQNTLIEDTEIDGRDQGFTAIAFGSFTALRVNIHGFENGLAFGDSALIQDSYIHDLNDSAGTHPDGAQFSQDSGDLTFKHDTIIAPVTNSAIIMWDEDGPQNYNVLLDSNLLAGGGFTLYCPRYNSTNVQVINNRFGPANFGPTSSCIPGHVASFAGNVVDLTGKPLTGS
jgi:hypothetical protein